MMGQQLRRWLRLIDIRQSMSAARLPRIEWECLQVPLEQAAVDAREQHKILVQCLRKFSLRRVDHLSPFS